jgi:hypothetical protein
MPAQESIPVVSTSQADVSKVTDEYMQSANVLGVSEVPSLGYWKN